MRVNRPIYIRSAWTTSKSKGKEKKGAQYNGELFSLIIQHRTFTIVTKCPFRAGEFLKKKHSFENFASNHRRRIKKYHADNAPFGARDFQTDLEIQGQESFSGVGAHHQNGVTERAIGTTIKWACTMLLHDIMHWPHATSQDLYVEQHAIKTQSQIPG
jgi:hypothetical protein